eukprot:CAMPEP_0117659778 /NCGR_PEP_ID=MMETSP0804-20121206/6613_1 /TAXON_ID=1074897 /ORGANISM="Tetraselmis astigmatica, Strain CCMP880" /LENGTH=675 /DNA_ID=CAMNT_0005466457 /DNA_START=160 /DNA_END=2187 /DNA_ORIENTATION=+
MPAVYVTYREDRKGTGKGSKKTVKYFLVEESGQEVLAVSGEDQGDAHYVYRSSDTFEEYGPLQCHNRKEVVAWLDHVIRSSGGAMHYVPMTFNKPVAATPVASKPEMTDLQLAATPLPGSTPVFVSFRQDKFLHSDTRRATRFYLLDKDGKETLAVSGDERENKDGHYIYKTDLDLPGLMTPSFNNMGEIQKWLESIIQRSGGAPYVTPYNNPSSSKTKNRGQKRAADSSGGPHRLGGAAEAAHARRLKLLKEEGDAVIRSANESYMAAMWHQVQRKSARRQAARDAAFAWVRMEATPEDHAALSGHRAVLETAAAAQETEGKPDPELPPAAPLTVVLEALREVGAMHLPLQDLCGGSGVLATMKRLSGHSSAPVAELAASILQGWRGLLAEHLSVLCNPEYTMDLASKLEEAARAVPRMFPLRAFPSLPGAATPSAQARQLAASKSLPSPFAGPASAGPASVSAAKPPPVPLANGASKAAEAPDGLSVAGLTPGNGAEMHSPAPERQPANERQAPAPGAPQQLEDQLPAANPDGTTVAASTGGNSAVSLQGAAVPSQAPQTANTAAASSGRTEARPPAPSATPGRPPANKTLPGKGVPRYFADKTRPSKRPRFGDKRPPGSLDTVANSEEEEEEEEEEGDDMEEEYQQQEEEEDSDVVGSPIGFGMLGDSDDGD